MNLHHNNATMAGAVFISGDYANIFNTDFYYNEALASKNVTAVDGLGGALYIVGQMLLCQILSLIIIKLVMVLLFASVVQVL